MNVIFTAIIKQLNLSFHSLSNMRFTDLIMKTADHRETLLHHWVYLKIRVKKIWRQIQCFMISELTFSVSETEQLSLLLRILWLYSVNVIIRIWGFKIEIENSAAEKAVQNIIDSELMFSQNHNLLIYLKVILTSHMRDDSDNEDTKADVDSDTDSSVSLSDEKKLKRVKSEFSLDSLQNFKLQRTAILSCSV